LAPSALLIAIAACSRVPSAPEDLGKGIDSVLSTFLAPPAPPPRVIVDEEISIAAHTWESRSFTLPTAHPVQIVADGKKNAEKGFTIHTMATTDLEHFKKDEATQPLSAFEGIKVRAFTHTDALSNGSWTVVVKNSENLRKPLVVHLRIVLDPG
jgi:hypothetical protein